MQFLKYLRNSYSSVNIETASETFKFPESSTIICFNWNQRKVSLLKTSVFSYIWNQRESGSFGNTLEGLSGN